MKKLGLVCALAIGLVFLAGCHKVIEETPEIIDEENVVDVIEEENVEEQPEVVEEEVIDGEKWNLIAFNGKEVDGDYKMIIKDNGGISVKFCNGIGGTVSFDGDNEGVLSASLIQTEMACEGESMNLENAFQIDGANYTIIANEDEGKTMLITTQNGDKFNWRSK